MDLENIQPSNLIAEKRKTPFLLINIFVNILQKHFSQLDDFYWSSDDNSSRIIIMPGYSYELSVTQKRPACFVQRGDIQYNTLVIDDLHTIHPIEDITEYTKLAQGSIIVNCLSEHYGTVEKLAAEVSDSIETYSPILRKELFFKKLDIVNIGKPNLLKEHSNLFIVPVIIAISFVEIWGLISKLPKIQDINVQLFLQDIENDI